MIDFFFNFLLLCSARAVPNSATGPTGSFTTINSNLREQPPTEFKEPYSGPQTIKVDCGHSARNFNIQASIYGCRDDGQQVITVIDNALVAEQMNSEGLRFADFYFCYKKRARDPYNSITDGKIPEEFNWREWTLTLKKKEPAVSAEFKQDFGPRSGAQTNVIRPDATKTKKSESVALNEDIRKCRELLQSWKDSAVGGLKHIWNLLDHEGLFLTVATSMVCIFIILSTVSNL